MDTCPKRSLCANGRSWVISVRWRFDSESLGVAAGGNAGAAAEVVVSGRRSSGREYTSPNLSATRIVSSESVSARAQGLLGIVLFGFAN